nr:FCD domain-containing protein [Rhodococcus sp. (in: high G+C Gram-positive bacteria)]
MNANERGQEVPDQAEPDDFEGPAFQRGIWHHSTESAKRVSLGGSRAEQAAHQIARLSAGAHAGDRIGSKDDLRRICGVSVGTINEAIKLAQARGVVTSRPGPGGGLFACDPSPLSRMNGWFRAAADDESAFTETVQIRNAIAPLLIDEVMREMTLSDQETFSDLLWEIRRARNSDATSDFIWACWNMHAHLAGIGKAILLSTLYLSIMDVGVSYIRAILETNAPALYLDPLADVMEDLVSALERREASAAIDAVSRTDPTLILRDPPTR